MESTTTDQSIELYTDSFMESTTTNNISDILAGNVTVGLSADARYPLMRYLEGERGVSAFTIALTALCVIGVLGNFLLSIIFFRFSSSTYRPINLGLSICDSVYLTSVFLGVGLTSFLREAGYNLQPHLEPYLYPIRFIGLTGSTFFIMVLALDRYLVICWPLRSRTFWNVRRAKFVSLGVMAFAIISNTPRMFGLTTEAKFDSMTNETVYRAVPTEFYKNLSVHSIKSPFYLAFQSILPFVVTCFLNFAIWRTFTLATEARKKMSVVEREENSLGLMLLSVLAVYFVCTSPTIVIQTLMAFKYYHIPRTVFKLARFMMTTNSAVNFIIYFLVGKKFRLETIAFFKEIFNKIISIF